VPVACSPPGMPRRSGEAPHPPRDRTATDRLISALDAERIEARLGTPAVVIPRGPLLARLAQDLPEGAVRCGTRFTRLQECGSQVRVWTQYDVVHTTVPRPVHAAADL
jgi:hypothetical protein